uniref:Uncharacterized protein n=1 Tax=Trichobilharzia regenti TaxID=157069 RepID=A0AA85J604_TRIRE|nr:unnamed protein product [Trichobilharzia regenti]
MIKFQKELCITNKDRGDSFTTYKTFSMKSTKLIGILRSLISNGTDHDHAIVYPELGVHVVVALILIIISITLMLIMMFSKTLWQYKKTMTTLITITSLLWCFAICIAFAYLLPETKYIVLIICIVLNALAVTLGITIRQLKKSVSILLFIMSMMIDLIGTVLFYLSISIAPIRNFQALAEICWCAGACIITFITINSL